MRKMAAILVALLLPTLGPGCVSTHMKQFVGKDVRYIAVQDGPPLNVFDMPDGRRAFQYRWGGGTYVAPKTVTTQGHVQLIGNEAYYSEQKLETGGYVVQTDGCLITYFAEWNAGKNGWIVVDISYPKQLAC